VLPTIIVAGIFAYTVVIQNDVDKSIAKPDVKVAVTAFQWNWRFDYTDNSTGKPISTLGTSETIPLLVLPTDRSIEFTLTSTDVIHSFFVPAFLFKKDVVPGRHNEFTFTATKLGTYQGQCAEFCGLHHAQMTFTLSVVPYADYLTWVKQQREANLNVSCPVNGNAVTVTAKNISWDTNCIAVNAKAPISLTVVNDDAGIDHNFAIYDGPDRKTELFQGGKFAGVATQNSQVPALAPGTYYFQCDVHGPAMSGTFIVAKPSGA
jgi:cytochrome c oxidase subunit II